MSSQQLGFHANSGCKKSTNSMADKARILSRMGQPLWKTVCTTIVRNAFFEEEKSKVELLIATEISHNERLAQGLDNVRSIIERIMNKERSETIKAKAVCLQRYSPRDWRPLTTLGSTGECPCKKVLTEIIGILASSPYSNPISFQRGTVHKINHDHVLILHIA